MNFNNFSENNRAIKLTSYSAFDSIKLNRPTDQFNFNGKIKSCVKAVNRQVKLLSNTHGPVNIEENNGKQSSRSQNSIDPWFYNLMKGGFKNILFGDRGLLSKNKKRDKPIDVKELQQKLSICKRKVFEAHKIDKKKVMTSQNKIRVFKDKWKTIETKRNSIQGEDNKDYMNTISTFSNMSEKSFFSKEKENISTNRKENISTNKKENMSTNRKENMSTNRRESIESENPYEPELDDNIINSNPKLIKSAGSFFLTDLISNSKTKKENNSITYNNNKKGLSQSIPVSDLLTYEAEEYDKIKLYSPYKIKAFKNVASKNNLRSTVYSSNVTNSTADNHLKTVHFRENLNTPIYKISNSHKKRIKISENNSSHNNEIDYKIFEKREKPLPFQFHKVKFLKTCNSMISDYELFEQKLKKERTGSKLGISTETLKKISFENPEKEKNNNEILKVYVPNKELGPVHNNNLNKRTITYIDKKKANLIRISDSYAKISNNIFSQIGDTYMNIYEKYAKDAYISREILKESKPVNLAKVKENQFRIARKVNSINMNHKSVLLKMD